MNTSDVIKSTGMIDIEFPIRIRFSPSEDNLKSIKRAVVYTADLLLSKFKIDIEYSFNNLDIKYTLASIKKY